MGCWNETCAISKMTIHCGESVRFLPIVQNSWKYEQVGGFPDGTSPLLLSGASGCYNNDHWTPVCIPIKAEYNDYGTVEHITDSTEEDRAVVSQFISAFKRYGIKLTVGKNECHDIPTNDFELEDILACLREGRVYFKLNVNGGYVTAPVGWVMIKESVWQSLLNTDFSKLDGYRGAEDYTLESVRENVKRAIDIEAGFDALGKISNAKKRTEKHLELHTLRMKNYRFENAGPFARSSIQSPIKTEKNPAALLNSLSEFVFVCEVLSYLRVSFAPTTGSGSQTDNRKHWQLVNEGFAKIAADEIAAWEKE